MISNSIAFRRGTLTALALVFASSSPALADHPNGALLRQEAAQVVFTADSLYHSSLSLYQLPGAPDAARETFLVWGAAQSFQAVLLRSLETALPAVNRALSYWITR